MYLIKRQQLYPEGDPIDCRDASGTLHLYQSREDAERAADGLRCDPHNKGWRFYVEQVPPLAGDARDIEMASCRDYLV